jgi:type I restriction enzyme, S subunit
MTWVTAQLGDLIEIKHGFAFKGEFFSDSGSYILLTPGNCYERGGLRLKGEKEKYYSGEIREEYILSAGDLIVVMTDLVNTAPILGGAFFIPEDNKYLHNQRLGL